MRGVITSSGRARFGIMGFDNWAQRCGVGHVQGSAITDAFSAKEAGICAAKQATQGVMPDLIIMSASAGYEEHIIAGINKVCKGVRVFGSTSANDTLVGESAHAPWQIYGSLAGWGAITDGGVVLLALWLGEACCMHNAITHCYGPTQHTGIITRASGRDILEIDGDLAADVFLQRWTGLSLSCGPQDFAQYSLAFDGRLVDIKGIGDNGELQCFASTADELGRCSVQLVHIKPSDVIGAIREVARKAKERLEFQVRGALVVICAGTSCMFCNEDFLELESILKDIAPEVMTMFSFGEQGNLRPGQNAFHGNHMLNLMFFM